MSAATTSTKPLDRKKILTARMMREGQNRDPFGGPASNPSVLFLSDRGLTGVDAATGSPRWEFANTNHAPRSLQPLAVLLSPPLTKVRTLADVLEVYELCVLLEGVVRLPDAAGHVETYRSGDTFLIPNGFTGTWETVEPVRKFYAVFVPRQA